MLVLQEFSFISPNSNVVSLSGLPFEFIVCEQVNHLALT